MRELVVSNLTPQTGSTITVNHPSYITSPGAPLQMLYYRTDQRSVWSAPVGTAEVATPVTPLGLTIVPKKANSLIVMQWMITGEINWNATWVIFEGNTPASLPGYQGYNNSFTGRWVGYVAGIFDATASGDVASTPERFNIIYSTVLNSTKQHTFYPAIKSGSATAYTFNLNRTNNALGQAAYENSISNGIIMEIAQ